MAEAGMVAKAKPPSATAPTNAYLRFFIWRLLSIRVRPNHPFTINENAGRRVPLLEDAAFRHGSNFTRGAMHQQAQEYRVRRGTRYLSRKAERRLADLHNAVASTKSARLKPNTEEST
jgi:hypothetical protein